MSRNSKEVNGGSRISQSGGANFWRGENQFIISHFFADTAWKWKNLDREEPCIPSDLLDPPMVGCGFFWEFVSHLVCYYFLLFIDENNELMLWMHRPTWNKYIYACTYARRWDSSSWWSSCLWWSWTIHKPDGTCTIHSLDRLTPPLSTDMVYLQKWYTLGIYTHSEICKRMKHCPFIVFSNIVFLCGIKMLNGMELMSHIRSNVSCLPVPYPQTGVAINSRMTWNFITRKLQKKYALIRLRNDPL